MQNASNRPKSDEGVGFDCIQPGTSQKVAFDSSVQSAALGARTSVVQLVATQDCHIAVGSNPTAVTDGTCMFLPKSTILKIGVAPGSKIAAIKDATGGNLFITEGA